jgi:hypothetical protein
MALTRINNQALTNVTSAGLPSGSVVQVKSTYNQTAKTTTSTAYVDTGMSLSITPTSASNKILVIVSQSISPITTSTNTFGKCRLLRDSTEIMADQRLLGTLKYGHTYFAITELDEPATTSQITYKTQFATGSSSYTMEAQHAALRPSTITLMEIAG